MRLTIVVSRKSWGWVEQKYHVCGNCLHEILTNDYLHHTSLHVSDRTKCDMCEGYDPPVRKAWDVYERIEKILARKCPHLPPTSVPVRLINYADDLDKCNNLRELTGKFGYSELCMHVGVAEREAVFALTNARGRYAHVFYVDPLTSKLYSTHGLFHHNPQSGHWSLS